VKSSFVSFWWSSSVLTDPATVVSFVLVGSMTSCGGLSSIVFSMSVSSCEDESDLGLCSGSTCVSDRKTRSGNCKVTVATSSRAGCGAVCFSSWTTAGGVDVDAGCCCCGTSSMVSTTALISTVDGSVWRYFPLQGRFCGGLD